MTKTRMFTLVVGLLLMAFSGFRLYSMWEEAQGNFWTPAHLALPVASAADHAAVYVSGTPVQKVVAEGRLFMAPGPGLAPLPLTSPDVTIAMNNSDHLRAVKIPTLMTHAGVVGAGFILFLFGLVAPTLKKDVYSSTGGLTELHLLHES